MVKRKRPIYTEPLTIKWTLQLVIGSLCGFDSAEASPVPTRQAEKEEERQKNKPIGRRRGKDQRRSKWTDEILGHPFLQFGEIVSGLMYKEVFDV